MEDCELERSSTDQVGVTETAGASGETGSPKKLWDRVREMLGRRRRRQASGKDEDSGSFWKSFHMVHPQRNRNLLVFMKKQQKAIFNCLEKEHGTSSSASSSQIGKVTGWLKLCATGLGKSGQDFRVFSFGFGHRCKSLPKLDTIFPEDRVEMYKSDYVDTGILSTGSIAKEAWKVVNWVNNRTDRVAVILGGSDKHIKLLLVATLLLMQQHQNHQTRQDAIRNAHNLTALALNGDLVSHDKATKNGKSGSKLFSWFPSGGNSAGREDDMIQQKKKRSKKSDTTTSSSSKKKESELQQQQCILRTSCGLGEIQMGLREFSRENETICWRKMVLRKIILSHAPRAAGTNFDVDDGQLGGGSCRPYIMIMNSDQSDFIYSTMVQGIKEFVYERSVDLEFNINVPVMDDIVLKLYHLEPGNPGNLILKFHVNIASAEPVEDANIYAQHQQGEQLVMVTIDRGSMDDIESPEMLGPDFSIACVFGMTETDRKRAQRGPKPFPSSQELAFYGPQQQNAGVVDKLDFSPGLPPLQFKCPSVTCGLVQYIEQDVAQFQCTACRTKVAKTTLMERLIIAMNHPPPPTRPDQSSSSSMEHEEEEEEVVNAADNHTTEQEQQQQQEIEEQVTPVPPSHPPPPPDPAPEPLHERYNESGYDVDGALEERLDNVCDILAYLPRQDLQTHLRNALWVCQSDQEADQVTQNFVTQIFDRQQHETDTHAMLAAATASAIASSAILHRRSGSVSSSTSSVHTSSDGNRGGVGESAESAATRASAIDLSHRFMDYGVLMDSLTDEERIDLLRGLFGLATSASRSSLDGRILFSYRSRPYRRRRGHGLSINEISRLPVHIYNNTDSSSSDGRNCSVCLCDFENGDELRTLPCFHSYHTNCIDPWLSDNSKCPVCHNEVGNTGAEGTIEHD